MQITGGIFKSLRIEPFTLKDGLLYFINSPEIGIEEFLIKGKTLNSKAGRINFDSEIAVKVGTHFKNGKIDISHLKRLLRVFEIESSAKSNLTGAFKIAIMEGFTTYDFLFINRIGLSNTSLFELIEFLRLLLQKNKNKSALIVQYNAVNTNWPFAFKEINLNEVNEFKTWLETMEERYRV